MTVSGQASADLEVALLEAGSLGGFFELDLRPKGGGWTPLATLVIDPSAAHARIGRIRADLATRAGVPVEAVEPRVAASLMQLGLAARVASPAVASLLTSGWVPHLTPDRLFWQDRLHNPVPLALDDLVGRRVSDAPAGARALLESVVEPVLVPLGESTRSAVAVSDRVLRGNIVSALAAAATMTARARPEVSARAQELLTHIVGLPGLDGLGSLGEHEQFRRRTCCLYYRLPGGGLCEDCVLADREIRGLPK